MKGPSTLRRFWLSIPAPARKQIALWYALLCVAGFFLPDHWSTHGGMARATDASGGRWYADLEDKVAYYYGQPWSHTLHATWYLAPSLSFPPSTPTPAVTSGAISRRGPLALTPDPPNATGRLFEREEQRSSVSDQLNDAAVQAARAPTLTFSDYVIDWRGATARVLYPLAAVSALMLLIAFSCRRDRPKMIAAGICPECTYPLVPRRDAPSGRQCPECGATYSAS